MRPPANVEGKGLLLTFLHPVRFRHLLPSGGVRSGLPSDAFELWCWRSLLRLPWTARRTNQSILKEINPHLEAAQGAPRDPRRDLRGERSPWLPLETRPDSPGAPQLLAFSPGKEQAAGVWETCLAPGWPQLRSGLPFGPRSQASLQKAQGPGVCFSNTTVQKHQFLGAQLSSQSNSHIHT